MCIRLKKNLKDIKKISDIKNLENKQKYMYRFKNVYI